MRNFREYISEAYAGINVDARFIEQNFDQINSELEALTEKPYQNAPVFLAQLRGVGDRYGISFPATMTKEFLNLDAEVVYSLGTTGYYFYAVYDTDPDGTVLGYAQIVTSDELSELVNSDTTELLSRETMERKPWIPPARRDDDSGNDSEYA